MFKPAPLTNVAFIQDLLEIYTVYLIIIERCLRSSFKLFDLSLSIMSCGSVTTFLLSCCSTYSTKQQHLKGLIKGSIGNVMNMLLKQYISVLC